MTPLSSSTSCYSYFFFFCCSSSSSSSSSFSSTGLYVWPWVPFWVFQHYFSQKLVVSLMPNPQPEGSVSDFEACSPRQVDKCLRNPPYPLKGQSLSGCYAENCLDWLPLA
jgi:hypothetical protein